MPIWSASSCGRALADGLQTHIAVFFCPPVARLVGSHGQALADGLQTHITVFWPPVARLVGYHGDALADGLQTRIAVFCLLVVDSIEHVNDTMRLDDAYTWISLRYTLRAHAHIFMRICVAAVDVNQ